MWHTSFNSIIDLLLTRRNMVCGLLLLTFNSIIDLHADFDHVFAEAKLVTFNSIIDLQSFEKELRDSV